MSENVKQIEIYSFIISTIQNIRRVNFFSSSP